jgi:hypothetical protein
MTSLRTILEASEISERELELDSTYRMKNLSTKKGSGFLFFNSQTKVKIHSKHDNNTEDEVDVSDEDINLFGKMENLDKQSFAKIPSKA